MARRARCRPRAGGRGDRARPGARSRRRGAPPVRRAFRRASARRGRRCGRASRPALRLAASRGSRARGRRPRRCPTSMPGSPVPAARASAARRPRGPARRRASRAAPPPRAPPRRARPTARSRGTTRAPRQGSGAPPSATRPRSADRSCRDRVSNAARIRERVGRAEGEDEPVEVVRVAARARVERSARERVVLVGRRAGEHQGGEGGGASSAMPLRASRRRLSQAGAQASSRARTPSASSASAVTKLLSPRPRHQDRPPSAVASEARDSASDAWACSMRVRSRRRSAESGMCAAASASAA